MNEDLTAKLPLKEQIKNIKTLWSWVYALDKTYFPTACIVHLINVIIPYAALLLSSYVLDEIAAGAVFKDLFIVAAAVTGFICILSFIAGTIWNRLEVRVSNMFRLHQCIVEEKMLSMDFSRIDSPEVKELKRRIHNDTNWGAGLYSFYWNLNGVLYGIMKLAGAVVIGFPVFIYIVRSKSISIYLILIFVCIWLMVGGKAIAHFRGKQREAMFHQYTEEERKIKSDFCWQFAQGDGFDYKNGKDSRIYDGYDLMKKWTLDKINGKEVRRERMGAMKSNGFLGGFFGVQEGVMSGGAYLTVGLLALTGVMSIGSIVRFAGCLNNIFTELVGMVNGIAELSQTCRQQASTFKLMGLTDEMYKGKLPVEKRSDNEYQIEFKDVSFKYPGSEEYALRHFSLKLKIGEKLAIVGMNGSGKTTMIKLLCRLYDTDEGEILLNGVDIRKFRQDEYSQLFSVVFQDYSLFSFSLGENVAVDTEYDREKVKKCLEDAGFGERLKTLENGIDTYLYKNYDESGVEISGGEAQKIALARAMYKKAPFILLDEPTAALDPLSEYEIYTNFDKIVENKTAVYISHRLSSCRFCKNIAVFHEGRIMKCGTLRHSIIGRIISVLRIKKVMTLLLDN